MLTGLSVGSAAAITLVTVSGSSGVLAATLSALGVFKAPTVSSNAVNELVMTVTAGIQEKSIENPLNFQEIPVVFY